MAHNKGGTHKGHPSPMDGANHMAIFAALVKAGEQGMHNPRKPKDKKRS